MLEALAAVARALSYAFALSAAGMAFALVTLRSSPDAERYGVRAMRLSAVATLLMTVVVGCLLVVRLGGDFDTATFSTVFTSGVGVGLALQVAGATMLLATAGDDAFSHWARASSALAITLAFAFSGHAAATSQQASLLAFVHVTAAAWWIASLWLLRRACTPGNLDVTVALVMRFSSIALVIVGGLALAGVLLIFALIDPSEVAWFDQYEQVLLVKVAIAVAALGIAAVNRLRLTPRLRRNDSSAAQTLRTAIGAELAMIAGVLVTTAVLTTYFSPHD